ncbi:hypothetical protein SAMN05443287_108131 [Micromonospora phaseoli]|uniref:Uncharacterized protein n=1 Tax=Micromonospora phaseoli TaxID=1144548 RepID=A0A1H7C6W1_9ACTN|nr:hypothetical protein [Micromonospora phaseoli]PZV92730.1 hypothetical protein CLV64_110153 [Micromonospora phaseoli]SEJ82782.1 hypothetical protein SAMN05443287_108131 [Micromonospora phaseoli]
MTSRAWLRQDRELVPGTEIFRSERQFAMEAYSASHRQLLLRSNPVDDEHETTIDLLFKPVEAIKIRDGFAGLVIRCATVSEAAQIMTALPRVSPDRGDRVFMLESQGRSDYVISMAFGWHEGILPRVQGSFFHTADAYLPRWPTGPLFGLNAGFNAAAAQDLVHALNSDDHRPLRRDRFRYVFVLMTDVDSEDRPKISGAGVFLTRADAEQAQSLLAAKVARCWIETLPVAM